MAQAKTLLMAVLRRHVSFPVRCSADVLVDTLARCSAVLVDEGVFDGIEGLFTGAGGCQIFV